MSRDYWMAEALRLQGEVEEQRKTIHQLKSAAIDARWEIDRLREVMAHMQASSAALRVIEPKSIEGKPHETHSCSAGPGQHDDRRRSG